MPRLRIARHLPAFVVVASLGSGVAAESGAPTAWQWVLLVVLVLGGLAVLTAARKRGPEAAEAVESTEALLAQYRRIATRSERTAPADEEISYQRAVLGALKPHLDRAIVAAPSPAEQAALRSVRSNAADLRKALRLAKGTALKSRQRAAVHEAARALGRAVQAARSSDEGEV